jgi:hypothetical protein
VIDQEVAVVPVKKEKKPRQAKKKVLTTPVDVQEEPVEIVIVNEPV